MSGGDFSVTNVPQPRSKPVAADRSGHRTAWCSTDRAIGVASHKVNIFSFAKVKVVKFEVDVRETARAEIPD